MTQHKTDTDSQRLMKIAVSVIGITTFQFQGESVRGIFQAISGQAIGDVNGGKGEAKNTDINTNGSSERLRQEFEH